MTEPSMWTRLTEENPQHSAAYIQRFDADGLRDALAKAVRYRDM